MGKNLNFNQVRGHVTLLPSLFLSHYALLFQPDITYFYIILQKLPAEPESKEVATKTVGTDSPDGVTVSLEQEAKLNDCRIQSTSPSPAFLVQR